ncbi:MAG: hypothetical protein ACYSWO_03165 [Planctomycetota bacterium]
MPATKNRESVAVNLQLVLCAIVLAFLFAGCQQRQQQQAEPSLAVSPDPATVSVSSDYATGAIEAAGGLDAWTKTKELRYMCVVALYQPDGSHYLSEQRYAVYPWSRSIQISAAEPEGTSVWQLSRGRFEVLQGSDAIDELSAQVPARCLAEAILNIVTVPARLLDASAEFAANDEPVKIQGQWYQPIDTQAKSGVFYQNSDSSLIDMFQFECAETGRSLTVRGYDYEKIEKGGVLAPTRIEVFATDTQGNLQERLVKIDCHTLGPAR